MDLVRYAGCRCRPFC
ncbi:hypothetical protein [Streptomyces yunnanensis]